MKKPHIKKLSKASQIFECISRESGKGTPFCLIGGYGLGPAEAYLSWRLRREFLLSKYSARHFFPNGSIISHE